MYFFNNWINKLFSEETRSPEHCQKWERWQGPPHINKVWNSVKLRCPLGSVCLFSLISDEKEES